MAWRERMARLSPDMQARFVANNRSDVWMDHCAALQRALVAEVCGYAAGTRMHRQWLRALRDAHYMFPCEPLFRTIPIQVRTNADCRSVEGWRRGRPVGVSVV
eukprot:m.377191 g.377191  ORF g.377191 m.377191 type:complete len:103 (-) comp20923_c0_seq87:4861-5169(-)